MKTDALKRSVAEAALAYIPKGGILGVGTGSTVEYLIESISDHKIPLEGAVASSIRTAMALQAKNIRVLDFNHVGDLMVYIDGADEINDHFQLIKGGGGALTREKILATSAKQFVCIADDSKWVSLLGEFPLPIEVIPMARSFVARRLVKLGGFPVYREGFVTDNGNVILDVQHLPMTDPLQIEKELNQIPGVVDNGIFALRPADVVLLGTSEGVKNKFV